MMKRFLPRGLLAACCLGLSMPLYAGEDQAHIALVSDYIFRGESVSGNQFTMMASYEYDYGTGTVLGLWLGSYPSDVEYDIYARYDGDYGRFGYSVGAIYYGYGQSTVPPEVNLALSYGELSVMSSQGPGVSYNEIAYQLKLYGVGLRLHAGSDGIDPDYSIEFDKQVSGIDIGLQVSSKVDSGTLQSTENYALILGKSF